MSEFAEKLTEVLDLHIKDHSDLLALEEKKREVIVKNDTELLEEINLVEEEIMQRVAAREVERQQYSAALCEDLGVDKEQKLSTIVELLGNNECGRVLADVRKKLDEVIANLRYRTTQNSELLYRSIEHIGAFFKTIAEARDVSPVYQRNGQTNGSQMRLLDQTA
ncbi:MAG: flagellar protein FlgN [Planctomycetota bacterium]|jgi:flagellar biosynthesis/type III secretory pathway chaperone